MAKRCSDTIHGFHVRGERPPYHDDLDTEFARRLDLGIGCVPTTVLGDDYLDAMFGKQPLLVFEMEGAHRENIGDPLQLQGRVDRIDAAHEIVVLGSGIEMMGFLPADRQEDAPWRSAERLHRLRHVRNRNPSIARDTFPGGTAQREAGNASLGDRLRRIGGNSRGKWMGRIDQQFDAFLYDEARKPVGAAETAASNRNGVGQRGRGAAGQREQHVEFGAPSQGLGELPRLRRTTQYQNAVPAHV